MQEKYMFNIAIRKWKQLEQSFKGNDNALYQEAIQLLRTRYVNPNFVPPKGATKEYRAARLVETLELIESISTDAKNISAMRNAIADEVIALARVLVLEIPASPESDSTGLRGRAGITGELNVRTEELFGIDLKLMSLKRKPHYQNLSEHEICTLISWSSRQRLQLLEALRHLIYSSPQGKDPESVSAPRDWLQTFIHAACATQEESYRRMLGLPDAFGDSLIRGMEYSTFEILVRSCTLDPISEFEAAFSRKNSSKN